MLLVETDLVVREVLTEMLQTHGPTVTSAEGPEHAIALSVAGGVYDLLITDLVMPKLDGYELAAVIATRSPSLRVIFISGYINASTRQALLEDGAAFLQKPFAIDDLAAKVREVLDGP